MANPLIAEYRNLANALDGTIGALPENDPTAARLTTAQGQLRGACVTMIANDIDAVLDPGDPKMAEAIATISVATIALKNGAAAIASDEKRVTTIVGLANDAVSIATSIVPLNVPAIIAAAQDTVKLVGA